MLRISTVRWIGIYAFYWFWLYGRLIETVYRQAPITHLEITALAIMTLFVLTEILFDRVERPRAQLDKILHFKEARRKFSDGLSTSQKTYAHLYGGMFATGALLSMADFMLKGGFALPITAFAFVFCGLYFTGKWYLYKQTMNPRVPSAFTWSIFLLLVIVLASTGTSTVPILVSDTVDPVSGNTAPFGLFSSREEVEVSEPGIVCADRWDCAGKLAVFMVVSPLTATWEVPGFWAFTAILLVTILGVFALREFYRSV